METHQFKPYTVVSPTGDKITFNKSTNFTVDKLYLKVFSGDEIIGHFPNSYGIFLRDQPKFY